MQEVVSRRSLFSFVFYMRMVWVDKTSLILNFMVHAACASCQCKLACQPPAFRGRHTKGLVSRCVPGSLPLPVSCPRAAFGRRKLAFVQFFAPVQTGPQYCRNFLRAQISGKYLASRGHPGVFRYNRGNHGIVVAQTDGPDIVFRIPGGSGLAVSHAVGHAGGVIVVNFIDGVSHLGIAVAIFGQELIKVDLRLHVGMGGKAGPLAGVAHHLADKEVCLQPVRRSGRCTMQVDASFIRPAPRSSRAAQQILALHQLGFKCRIAVYGWKRLRPCQTGIKLLAAFWGTWSRMGSSWKQDLRSSVSSLSAQRKVTLPVTRT